ncbi:unnamed protein product [Moneuplotes crassus]|uniref:Uncharacterized protein n=1 Tax=Euplotes crassus TaxID=5936 RepID=A0AAD2D8S0_EUPCR|nr:unnamed protein product [Moneuplotes crassus]
MINTENISMRLVMAKLALKRIAFDSHNSRLIFMLNFINNYLRYPKNLFSNISFASGPEWCASNSSVTSVPMFSTI